MHYPYRAKVYIPRIETFFSGVSVVINLILNLHRSNISRGSGFILDDHTVQYLVEFCVHLPPRYAIIPTTPRRNTCHPRGNFCTFYVLSTSLSSCAEKFDPIILQLHIWFKYKVKPAVDSRSSKINLIHTKSLPLADSTAENSHYYNGCSQSLTK